MRKFPSIERLKEWHLVAVSKLLRVLVIIQVWQLVWMHCTIINKNVLISFACSFFFFRDKFKFIILLRLCRLTPGGATIYQQTANHHVGATVMRHFLNACHRFRLGNDADNDEPSGSQDGERDSAPSAHRASGGEVVQSVVSCQLTVQLSLTVMCPNRLF